MSSEDHYHGLLFDIALKAVSSVSYWFLPPPSFSPCPSPQVPHKISPPSSPMTSSSSSPASTPVSRDFFYDSGHSLCQSASPTPSLPSSVHVNEEVITSHQGMFPNARGLTFNNCVFQDITSVQPYLNPGTACDLFAFVD